MRLTYGQRLAAVLLGLFVIGFVSALAIPGWGLYIMAGCVLAIMVVTVLGAGYGLLRHGLRARRF